MRSYLLVDLVGECSLWVCGEGGLHSGACRRPRTPSSRARRRPTTLARVLLAGSKGAEVGRWVGQIFSRRKNMKRE